MNKFNKIMLLGVLSIFAGASSVKCAAPATEDVSGFQWLDENETVTIMSNPLSGLDSTAKDYADAQDKRMERLNDFNTVFCYKTEAISKFDGISTVEFDFATTNKLTAITNALEDITSESIVAIFPDKNANLADQATMNELATFAACVMLKKNISTTWYAKVIADLGDKAANLTEEQTGLIKTYYKTLALENLKAFAIAKPAAKRSLKKMLLVGGGALMLLAAIYGGYKAMPKNVPCVGDASALIDGNRIQFKDSNGIAYSCKLKANGDVDDSTCDPVKPTDEQLKSLTGMTSEQLNKLTDKDFSSLFDTTEHGFMDGVRSNGIYKLFFTSAS